MKFNDQKIKLLSTNESIGNAIKYLLYKGMYSFISSKQDCINGERDEAYRKILYKREAWRERMRYL